MMPLTFTSKSYMIIILSAIGIVTMLLQKTFYPQFLLLPMITALIDIAVNYAKIRQIVLPSSAVISGLLLSMILQPLTIEMEFLAGLIAVLSKHVIIWKNKNIFNPAAFSVTSLSLLGVQTVWWGATLPIVLIGFFMPYYQHRLRMIAIFLATYFAIIAATTISFSIDYAAIFFAVFMLLEPKTSPYTKKGMILFGAFAAILAFVFGHVQGVDKFLLALVVMNVFTHYLNKKFR